MDYLWPIKDLQTAQLVWRVLDTRCAAHTVLVEYYLDRIVGWKRGFRCLLAVVIHPAA